MRLGDHLSLYTAQSPQIALQPSLVIAPDELLQTLDSRPPSDASASKVTIMPAIQNQRHRVINDPSSDTGDQEIQPPVMERDIDIRAGPLDKSKCFSIEAHGISAGDTFDQGIEKAWGTKASGGEAQWAHVLVDDLRRSTKEERPLAAVVVAASKRFNKARELVWQPYVILVR